MKSRLLIGLCILFLFLLSSCSKDVILSGSPDTLYECVSKDMVQDCPGGLSGGIHTRCYYEDKSGWSYCSEGWIAYESESLPKITSVSGLSNPHICGEYFCYPNTDYCRFHGLISHPKVKRSEVCA